MNDAYGLAVKNALKSAIILSLLASTSPAFADSTYSEGVKTGIKLELAYALATCRKLNGEEGDWLSYYLRKLSLPRELAISLGRYIPAETMEAKASKVIDYFGSCEDLLDLEDNHGIEIYQEHYIKPAHEKFCSTDSRC